MILDRLPLSTAVRSLAVLAVVGLVAVFLSTWAPLRGFLVGGPAYRAILSDKDLVADALPPPLYPVAAHVAMLELARGPDAARRQALVGTLTQAGGEFDESARRWEATDLDPGVRAALERSQSRARAFFAAADEVAAAATAGDAAGPAVEKAEGIFRELDAANAELVSLLKTEVATREQAVAARAERALRTVLATLVVAVALLGLVAGLLVRAVSRAIRRLHAAGARLRELVVTGRLADRVPVDDVHPDLRCVAEAMNATVDAFTSPMALATDYVTSIAHGRRPPRIDERGAGDFAHLTDGLNELVDMMARREQDMGALIQAATEGRLDARADASRYEGGHRNILEGMNRMMDVLGAPVRRSAEYLARISRGDLPASVEGEFPGDFAAVRESLQAVVTALSGLHGEFARVTQELAAGENDAATDEARFVGAYRELAAGFNGAIRMYVGIVREILAILRSYAEGNFEPSLRDLPGKQARATAALRLLRTNLRGVTDQIRVLAESATHGELAARARVDAFQGDWATLVGGLNEMLEAIVRPVDEATGVLERLSSRDLRPRVEGGYAGHHARMKDAVNGTADALHEALAQVASAVEQVSSAATQIASSSQAVASGASEQAGALEETSASVESLSEMTRQLADHAQQASALATTARGAASDGTQTLEGLQRAMERIRQAAERTSQIIRDVSDIAFQTNLLALNAAVEAARAGEAGRGFAVVAEEVRSLALRAKEAATRTEELIRQSVQEAGDGEAAARQASGKLSEIAQGIAKTTDLVTEMAGAAREQASGIVQVSRAISEMERVTQQNAASAEESSAAAGELSGQAEELAAMVATFQLAQRTAGGPRRGEKRRLPAGAAPA